MGSGQIPEGGRSSLSLHDVTFSEISTSPILQQFADLAFVTRRKIRKPSPACQKKRFATAIPWKRMPEIIRTRSLNLGVNRCENAFPFERNTPVDQTRMGIPKLRNTHPSDGAENFIEDSGGGDLQILQSRLGQNRDVSLRPDRRRIELSSVRAAGTVPRPERDRCG